jgi:hypothetical protein
LRIHDRSLSASGTEMLAERQGAAKGTPSS